MCMSICTTAVPSLSRVLNYGIVELRRGSREEPQSYRNCGNFEQRQGTDRVINLPVVICGLFDFLFDFLCNCERKPLRENICWVPHVSSFILGLDPKKVSPVTGHETDFTQYLGNKNRTAGARSIMSIFSTEWDTSKKNNKLKVREKKEHESLRFLTTLSFSWWGFLTTMRTTSPCSGRRSWSAICWSLPKSWKAKATDSISTFSSAEGYSLCSTMTMAYYKFIT